jgi:hypothetical protein
MTRFRLFDRTAALRCKVACDQEREITVTYPNGRGLATVTGIVKSVYSDTSRRAKPFWTVTIDESLPDPHAGVRVVPGLGPG